MKVAFWALGILVLSMFGLLMINLFGNITVTNQLNYTTMKNTVEAAMYDSLDKVSYRKGFCLCTDKSKVDGKWQFTSQSDYEVLDVTYDSDDNEECDSDKTCEILYGEYRLDKKVFAESLVRRFAEMVGNNKDYDIVIKDIIEYPPKVSVRVDSKDRDFSPTEKNSDGYTIVNQMDAIIETWNEIPEASPASTPAPIKYEVTAFHVAKDDNTLDVASPAFVIRDDNKIGYDDNYDDICPADSYEPTRLFSEYKNSYIWDKQEPQMSSSDKASIKDYYYDSSSGCIRGTLTKNIDVKYFYEKEVSTDPRIRVLYVARVPNSSGSGYTGKKICEYVDTKKSAVSGSKFVAKPCSVNDYISTKYYLKDGSTKHEKYEHVKYASDNTSIKIEGIGGITPKSNDNVEINKSLINQNITITYYYDEITCNVLARHFALDASGNKTNTKVATNNTGVTKITYKIGETFERSYLASSSLSGSYKNKYEIKKSKTTVSPTISGAIKSSGAKAKARIIDKSMCNSNGNILVNFYYKEKKPACYMRHINTNQNPEEDKWDWTYAETITDRNKKISNKNLQWTKVDSITNEGDCHCTYGWQATATTTQGRKYKNQLDDELIAEGKLHKPPKFGDFQWDAGINLGNGVWKFTKFIYGCASETTTTGCTWHFSAAFTDEDGDRVTKTGGSYTSCGAAYDACRINYQNKKDYSCMGFKRWAVYDVSKSPPQKTGTTITQTCFDTKGDYSPKEPCKGMSSNYKCVCGG